LAEKFRRRRQRRLEPANSLSRRAQRHPLVSSFDIGTLHREPRSSMRDLFLARLAPMRGEGVIERLPINVLRMQWQTIAHRWRKIFVVAVWHGSGIIKQEPVACYCVSYLRGCSLRNCTDAAGDMPELIERDDREDPFEDFPGCANQEHAHDEELHVPGNGATATISPVIGPVSRPGRLAWFGRLLSSRRSWRH